MTGKEKNQKHMVYPPCCKGVKLAHMFFLLI